MDIPITFEAKEKTSPLLEKAEKTFQETRPRVYSDPPRSDFPRTWKIPISIESHIERKKDSSKSNETWDLQGNRAFAPSKFGFSSDLPREKKAQVGSSPRRKKSETSEAYFVIPIHHATSKNKKTIGGKGKETQQLERGKDDSSFKSPNTSVGASLRDAQKHMFTPEKPQKRSEISFEVSPGKKIVSKSGNEDDGEKEEENMENLSLASNAPSLESRQDASSQEEKEQPSLKDNAEPVQGENRKVDSEMSHVAYTKDEIGVMKGEISKLEKISEIMKNAVVLWSRVDDLPGENDNEKELREAEEMLTKCILNLDEIEVSGNEQIKNERKKAVQAIEGLLLNLEKKMKSE